MIGNIHRESPTTRLGSMLLWPSTNSGMTSGATRMKSADSAPRMTAVSQSTMLATRHASGSLPSSRRCANTGHERGRDRAVGDQAAHQVGDVERDQERPQSRARAEEAGRDDLADHARHARDRSGRPEHRRRRGQTTLFAHRRRSLSTRCYALDAPPAGGHLRVSPKGTGGQLQAAGKASPNSGASAAARTCATARRSRRCSGASTRRSTRATPSRSQPHTGAWSSWSTGRQRGRRSIATRPRGASRRRPGSVNQTNVSA